MMQIHILHTMSELNMQHYMCISISHTCDITIVMLMAVINSVSVIYKHMQLHGLEGSDKHEEVEVRGFN